MSQASPADAVPLAPETAGSAVQSALAGARRPWSRLKTGIVGVVKWYDSFLYEEAPVPVAKPRPAAAPAPAPEAAGEWTPERIRVAQKIWGDGFSFPGGADYAVHLAKTLCLTNAQSMLDLGCGLGGATRAIQESSGVWVTGMEASKKLADAGMALSTRLGMARSAPVQHFDPATAEFPARKFDAILARHVLTPVADRRKLLERIAKAARPGAGFLLLDFAAAASANTSSAVAAWREAEACPALPQPLEIYTRWVKELGFDVRVTEDISEEFRRHVLCGWERLSEELAGKAVEPDEAAEFRREVELWGKRLAALKSGGLQVIRILGFMGAQAAAAPK